jgi:hypothetical protein
LDRPSPNIRTVTPPSICDPAGLSGAHFVEADDVIDHVVRNAVVQGLVVSSENRMIAFIASVTLHPMMPLTWWTRA